MDPWWCLNPDGCDRLILVQSIAAVPTLPFAQCDLAHTQRNTVSVLSSLTSYVKLAFLKAD